MTTNQEARQIAIRDVTSTTGNTSSDWHALFDDASIAAGPFNARMLSWINDQLGTSHTNLPGAMHAYAVDQGFSSWASMATFTPGSSLSAYAVGENDPKFVADFAGTLNSGTPYFRKAGSDSTFSGLFTHARSSNATMTDSDGNLKWAPHNLLTYSNALSTSPWSASFGSSITDNGDGSWTFDAAGSAARFLSTTATGASGAGNHILAIEAKAGTSGWLAIRTTSFATDDLHYYNLSGAGAVGALGTYTESIESLGDGWYLCLLEIDTSSDSDGAPRFYAASADETVAGGTVLLRNARYYRSDLGGMVNNPDRGDSYVPTTSAARYLPRRNHYRYNGTSYVKKGLLLESAAATNLQTYSGNFSTQWDADNATVTDNQRTGPDGATSMAAVAETTANNFHGISDKVVWTATSGVSYTTSAYVALRGSTQYVQICYGSARFGSTQYATFDLINGTVSGSAIGTGRIEHTGSGIYRIAFTAAATGSGVSEVFILSTNAATGRAPSFAGNTANGFFVYGVQTEAGSVPTSYIPTSGATATRAAETLTIAGANMAASTSAMSFQMQGEMTYADDGGAGVGLWSWYSSATDYIAATVAVASTRTGEPTLTTENSNVLDQVTGSASAFSPGVSVAFNMAARTTSSAINLAVGGTAATENATLTGLSDYSATAFQFGKGQNAFTNPPFVGTIALFRQWDVDLGDSGIEAAST